MSSPSMSLAARAPDMRHGHEGMDRARTKTFAPSWVDTIHIKLIDVYMARSGRVPSSRATFFQGVFPQRLE
ncbi:hypothetical protein [Massilia antarctica]|uniref:hypothetical protein n=1 Tax=Massilia antarctica TaxID=2765360 RepID=UPI001E63158A|nr:hypothetical protein [Massilia antarctica]